MLPRLLIRASALLVSAAPLPLLACSGQLHIELEHAGVYALDHAAIAAKQPALADCAVADLALSQGGREVPIRVVAKGDRFADGDHLEWIGLPLHGPESWYDAFSVNNVYLLGAAPGAHARIRDADPADDGHAALERVTHVEQENLMIRLDQAQQKPGEEADVWQWAKLTHVDPKPFETRFDLPDLDTRGGSVKLTLDLRGLSEVAPPAKEKASKPDDHLVEISVNGHALAPLAWNGRDEVRRDLAVPSSMLNAAGNVLTLRVPKRPLPWAPAVIAVDVVMFNWVEARYPITGDLDAGAQSFSVRDGAPGALQLGYRGAGDPVLYGSDGVRRPGKPTTAGRYAFAAAPADTDLYPAIDGKFAQPGSMRAVAQQNWRGSGDGFDYLIVAHPKLMDAIRPLAQFHEKRGLKVAVLDVDRVYDQFNHGITHPQAIRNLVAAATRDLARKPRFLLLVGDASFDIRHDTYNDLNYAKWTDQELLFPGHFGAVPGSQYKEKTASLADRNLIPTWQYPSPEGQSASDNWFGAVNGDDWHPVVAVGRFPVIEPAEVKAIVDKTIAYISTPQLGAWRRDVMFITDEIEGFKQASDTIAKSLGKDGFLADKVYASPKETENALHQTAIRDGIDEGRLLVHFIGHGGRYIWRTGPVDLRKNADLFTLDDVSSLKNGALLPMVLSMTCYSAPFDNPTEDSIGERFLREPGKGAIAVFAASWRNTPSPAYSTAVMHELLQPGATIGEAIVRAKKGSPDRTLVEMYNLLGDPAVVLERPRDVARTMVDGDRWNRGILIDLGQNRFDGNVAVDWLDDKGARLVSSTYHSNDTRFRLPLPLTPSGTIATARIYASSPTTGRDAIGSVDMSAESTLPAAQSRWSAWWKRLVEPAAKTPVRTEDTIEILGFDGPAAGAPGNAH
ncbi:MAG: C25 family cysteine peptidase [Dokdonella sp.]|uniref:C25 family cysteine peptidase n=1 Tax=Dokdonella sp. TaxID=2291710 RepID=UPI003262F11E